MNLIDNRTICSVVCSAMGAAGEVAAQMGEHSVLKMNTEKMDILVQGTHFVGVKL